MDALILIDIQNDYFPGGRMTLEGSEAAAASAARLLAEFRRLKKPVFHVQHVSIREGASFFLPDTPGVNIHPAVTPRADETVIRKHFPNAFRNTTLEEELRRNNVKQVLIVGMMSHMCIDTSVRAAADLGYLVSIAHDACATRALRFGETEIPAAQVHAAFMAALGGGFARVLSSEELLAG